MKFSESPATDCGASISALHDLEDFPLGLDTQLRALDIADSLRTLATVDWGSRPEPGVWLE
jgi:hypothetical protein